MMQMVKLNDINDPIATTKGIFKSMHHIDTTLTFLTDDNVVKLDIEYYYGHSNQKYISRLYQILLDKEEKGLINSALDEIAKTILTIYKDNWINIYKAFTEEYNPLENYRMNEKENVKSKVITSVSGDSSTYGFNSDEAVPVAQASNSQTVEGAKDDNERDLTRSGNIGVTTSQQMLSSELELRKYKFYVELMNDIDKIMCLACY